MKRFIMYSLAGAFALQGVGLHFGINKLWALEPIEQKETVIAEGLAQPATDDPAPEGLLAEPTSESRSLRDLLEDLRRLREQASETENDLGTEESDRSRSGTRSREITCQGCDFDYPQSANGAEGTVEIIVETDEQGQVVDVTVVRSSGNAELDRAALQQARERVRLEGARAGERYPIRINFMLGFARQPMVFIRVHLQDGTGRGVGVVRPASRL